jgi:hypothetical protein
MKTILAAFSVLTAAMAVGCGAASPDGEPSATGEPSASSAPAPAATEKTATASSKVEAAAEPNPDLIILRRCNAATCEAAGGYCSSSGILGTCEPGCENSPGSCTATVANPINGYGFIGVTCTGVGNGVYTVSETAAPPVETGLGTLPPSTGWVGYNPYGTGTYQYVLQGQQVQFAVDESDMYLPGCNVETGQGCQIHATYVEVCAEPGTGQFTEQSGICGNLESFPQQCVTVPVTYQ